MWKWFESTDIMPLSAAAASVYLCSICCLISKIPFKFYQHMKKIGMLDFFLKKKDIIHKQLSFITKRHR